MHIDEDVDVIYNIAHKVLDDNGSLIIIGSLYHIPRVMSKAEDNGYKVDHVFTVRCKTRIGTLYGSMVRSLTLGLYK